MRGSSSSIAALLAVLPLLIAAPLPIKRDLLSGLGGNGLLSGGSDGPLNNDPVGLAHIISGGSSPLSGLPLGLGDSTSNNGLLAPLTGSQSGSDGLSSLTSNLLSPNSGLHNGLLDDLLSPLTSTLSPVTDALGDVLDLVVPTKLICADVGALLLRDVADISICACVGLGLRKEGMDGTWIGNGRQGGLEGLGLGVGLVGDIDLQGLKDKVCPSDLYETERYHLLTLIDPTDWA